MSFGFNNYGMGGMGRGQGGSEMMIMMVVCACSMCVVSSVLAYMSNALCGVGLGAKCQPAVTEAPETYPPMPLEPEDSSAPGRPTGGYCNPTYAGQSRGANDPRPPLKADACTAAGPQTGRDCFYWQTQPDALTGLAKWVRIQDPNNSEVDSFNKSCSPVVTGPNRVDFASQALAGYTDNNADPLVKLFRANNQTATTTEEMLPLITQTAKKYGVRNWAAAQSKLWVQQMGSAFIGRNLAAHIHNTGLAVQAVKKRLNLGSLSPATFAGMLEAAVNPPLNQADWINSVATNQWAQDPSRAGNLRLSLNETGYVLYLQWAIKKPLKNWPLIITNPRYLTG